MSMAQEQKDDFSSLDIRLVSSSLESNCLCFFWFDRVWNASVEHQNKGYLIEFKDNEKHSKFELTLSKVSEDGTIDRIAFNRFHRLKNAKLDGFVDYFLQNIEDFKTE